jgi:NAD(P)-dependent dehydrogenase (short-subunit alcohol dehydrogenase family)
VYLKYLYPNMAAKSPVMLLLGFGPNVGHHVSEAFTAKGYIVARASRKIKEEESTATQINIPIDLSDPESVIGVFSKLKDTYGFPSVVVYNGTSSFHYLKLIPHLY